MNTQIQQRSTSNGASSHSIHVPITIHVYLLAESLFIYLPTNHGSGCRINTSTPSHMRATLQAIIFHHVQMSKHGKQYGIANTTTILIRSLYHQT
jgi:hypothetical protein